MEGELKRNYLLLLPHSSLVDLLLSLDAGTTSVTAVFPTDLRAEIDRLRAVSDAPNPIDLDADGEGSPDPPPTLAVSPSPSVAPAGGPRTRAGAARAYAAALATSKDATSARPSPAPGGISFPSVGSPEPRGSSSTPGPMLYPPPVQLPPDASSPIAGPSTPAPITGPPLVWQSPSPERSANPSTGPIRGNSGKKTRTGVVGGYNPITTIGPSSEGLPSYEEMIVLALMDGQNNEGIAPKDVFAWMSARWPLNANFRPSASQALQKAFKRGRLEKVGAKYKLNPNWHGGATTNRTTRRPQSMAELPGNYAWAPPPVPPVQTLPPDPRVRGSTPPQIPIGQSANPGSDAQESGPELDPQVQVASLIRALQDHNHPGEVSVQISSAIEQEGQGQPQHVPHATMPSVSSAGPSPDTIPAPSSQTSSETSAPIIGSNSIPGVPSMPHASAVVHNGIPYPGYHAPTPLQASLATLASQLAHMSKSSQGA